MNHRALGNSGLYVSELCLGTMMFADQTDLDEARRIAAHAREHGVNFIDTADVYSKGQSESMVGELVRGQRNDWIVATKLGNKMSEQPDEWGYSRTWMQKECDASLARLNTDRIDLYYLHRDYLGLDLEQPLLTMGELIRAGKVRHWGLSNFRGHRIVEAVMLARQLGVPAPVACQPYYNLLNRMPEVEILPACERFGLGVVPYSPIARGVLTGKYRAGLTPDKHTRAGRNDPRILQTEFRVESFAVADQLKVHCEASGRTLPHFATAWVLAHRAVSAVIAGPRTFEQWVGYVGALDCPLSAADEALVDALVKPGHPSTPGYSDPMYPIESRR